MHTVLLEHSTLYAKERLRDTLSDRSKPHGKKLKIEIRLRGEDRIKRTKNSNTNFSINRF